MLRKPSKPKTYIQIIIKHWRKTTGSLLVIVSVFMLIFKLISIETLAAIISSLIAAGYIPKSKDNESE